MLGGSGLGLGFGFWVGGFVLVVWLIGWFGFYVGLLFGTVGFIWVIYVCLVFGLFVLVGWLFVGWVVWWMLDVCGRVCLFYSGGVVGLILEYCLLLCITSCWLGLLGGFVWGWLGLLLLVMLCLLFVLRLFGLGWVSCMGFVLWVVVVVSLCCWVWFCLVLVGVDLWVVGLVGWFSCW